MKTAFIRSARLFLSAFLIMDGLAADFPVLMNPHPPLLSVSFLPLTAACNVPSVAIPRLAQLTSNMTRVHFTMWNLLKQFQRDVRWPRLVRDEVIRMSPSGEAAMASTGGWHLTFSKGQEGFHGSEKRKPIQTYAPGKARLLELAEEVIRRNPHVPARVTKAFFTEILNDPDLPDYFAEKANMPVSGYESLIQALLKDSPNSMDFQTLASATAMGVRQFVQSLSRLIVVESSDGRHRDVVSHQEVDYSVAEAFSGTQMAEAIADYLRANDHAVLRQYIRRLFGRPIALHSIASIDAVYFKGGFYNEIYRVHITLENNNGEAAFILVTSRSPQFNLLTWDDFDIMSKMSKLNPRYVPAMYHKGVGRFTTGENGEIAMFGDEWLEGFLELHFDVASEDKTFILTEPRKDHIRIYEPQSHQLIEQIARIYGAYAPSGLVLQYGDMFRGDFVCRALPDGEFAVKLITGRGFSQDVMPLGKALPKNLDAALHLRVAKLVDAGRQSNQTVVVVPESRPVLQGFFEGFVETMGLAGEEMMKIPQLFGAVCTRVGEIIFNRYNQTLVGALSSPHRDLGDYLNVMKFYSDPNHWTSSGPIQPLQDLLISS